MIGINVEGLIRIQYFDVINNKSAAEAALEYATKLVRGGVDFEVTLIES